MPAKIRVFVSSTMEDLANEREAVVEVIRSLNFDPVNAEGILPTGGTSWEVLEAEIETSHICILMQGERYGWIPTEGYGAGQGKSVTHLEVDLARRLKIPVLPFLKTLKYRGDSTSPDAILRDKFRNEIGDWNSGLFRGEFKLASDLKTKAFQALLDVLTGSYLNTRVRARASDVAAKSPPEVVVSQVMAPARAVDSSAPPEILFAGAGMSLSAGYPSANAIAGVVCQALELDPVQTSRHSLAQLFELAEATLGRDRSLAMVNKLLDPPLPVEPTPAHMAAVQRFPVIVTTNFDKLFERACEALKISYVVCTPGQGAGDMPKGSVTIFKIDGTIDEPSTLVLSSTDVDRAWSDRSYWDALSSILQKSRPIIIGHSLRDANSLRVLKARNLQIKGVYVAPVVDPFVGRLLLGRLNLDAVESMADDYLLRPA